MNDTLHFILGPAQETNQQPVLAQPPDDGLLVDLIREIAPAEPARRLLLVDNPVKFFGFGAAR